jgi:phosphoserine phosphatase RsbU/P
MAYLINQEDGVIKRRFALDKDTMVIGRHPDCDIVVDDNSVSRRHAQIRRQGNQYFISDLNSRNGTLVNRELVQRETLLFENSEIEICEVVFQFVIDKDAVLVKPRPTAKDKLSSLGIKNRPAFALDDLPNHNSSIISSMGIVPRRGDSPSDPGGKSLSGYTSNIEKKLAALITVTQSLQNAHESDEIMQRVLDSLFELFIEADRGFVAMLDPQGAVIPFAMKTRHEQDAERVRISRTVIKQVLDSQQAILSQDATTDQRFELSQSMADFRIRSLMCAPLINSQGVAIGAIQLDTLRSAIAFNDNDLEVLVTAAMQASLALQNAELHQRVLQSKKLEDDLKLANAVQQRFLPQRHPEQPGYEFSSHYSPMSQVGGDYFDLVPLGENRLAVIVADVVGHGIAAAMLMAKISAEARYAFAINDDPRKAVQLMNRNLSDLNLDKFVTLIAGVMDFSQHAITLVNAGHQPPILIPAGKKKPTELRIVGSGLPLGILDSVEYGAERIELNAGDCLVLYTDGVNECMNAKGDQLGVPALLAELHQSQAKGAGAIGKVISQTVQRHRGNYQQIDDICLVAVSREL